MFKKNINGKLCYYGWVYLALQPISFGPFQVKKQQTLNPLTIKLEHLKNKIAPIKNPLTAPLLEFFDCFKEFNSSRQNQISLNRTAIELSEDKISFFTTQKLAKMRYQITLATHKAPYLWMEWLQSDGIMQKRYPSRFLTEIFLKEMKQNTQDKLFGLMRNFERQQIKKAKNQK